METKELEELLVCEEALIYFQSCTSYKEGWEKCPRGDWMLWIAEELNVDNRKLTLAKGKCANTVIHLMKDERSRKAVQAAIDYGNNLIEDEELRNAYADAAAIAAAAAIADAAAAIAAYADAAAIAAAAAIADAADAYVAAYADAAAYAAADAYAAAKKRNQQLTADICREILTEEIDKAWKEIFN